jgi:hypothetical protein
MSFDEMYDDMLHDEFSSRGKHQATAVTAEPELAESSSRGRHAAADEPEAVEGPRGFQRYKTAALVGAGGMACAAAGAFLGGLGGYFAISPAAAHALAAPTITQDLPLAQAVSHGSHSSSGAKGTSAVMAAEFSKVFGSLTQGIAPFASLTSEPFGNLPLGGLPGRGGGTGTGGGGIGNGTVGGGGGGGGGGGVTGCTSGSSGLDLTCILSGLTGVLGNLGSLTGNNPGSMLSGLVPTLTGVVTDVTGTLQNLTSLLPIASLPLPSGGIPTTVLAGSGGGPVTGVPSTTGGGTSGRERAGPGAQHRGVRDERPRLDGAVDPLAPVAHDDRHDAAEPAAEHPFGNAHQHAERRLLGRRLDHSQRAAPGVGAGQHADHLHRRLVRRGQRFGLDVGPHAHAPLSPPAD